MLLHLGAQRSEQSELPESSGLSFFSVPSIWPEGEPQSTTACGFNLGRAASNVAGEAWQSSATAAASARTAHPTITILNPIEHTG